MKSTTSIKIVITLIIRFVVSDRGHVVDIDIMTTPPTELTSDDIELDGRVGRLRICDPTKIATRVRFSSFPKCPETKDYNTGQQTVEGGTAILFKPNLVQVTAHGYKCYQVRSVRRSVTNALGLQSSVPANWKDIDERQPVDVETCKRWVKDRECKTYQKHDRVTHYNTPVWSTLPESKHEVMKFQFIRQDANSEYLATKREVVAGTLWSNIVETTTYNCHLETLKIISNAPYNIIRTAEGIIGVKKRIFSLDDSVVTDEATYIWRKPDPPNLCDYIVDEIHSDTVVKQFMDGESHFYLILTEAQHSMYINPKKQKIHLGNESYHAYCITTALSEFDKSELYIMPSGLLVGYIGPNTTREEIHNEIINKTGGDLRRSVNMNDRKEGEDDPTEGDDAFFESNGESKKQRKKRKKRLVGVEPFSPRNAGWMIGDEKITASIRYFFENKIKNWTQSISKQQFEVWCANALYRHTLARTLSNMNPSEVLSAYMGQDILARKMGDLFEISQCRYVTKREYRVLPTLRVPGDTDMCYTRPLISIYDSLHNKDEIGQVLYNKQIIFPPVMSEACKSNSLFYFYIQNMMYIYKNYQLVYGPSGISIPQYNINSVRAPNGTVVNTTVIDERQKDPTQAMIDTLSKLQVEELGVRDIDIPNAIEPMNIKVALHKPSYSFRELDDVISPYDAMLAANYRRRNDQKLQQFINAYTRTVRQEPSMAEINEAFEDAFIKMGTGILGIGNLITNTMNGFTQVFFGAVDWVISNIENLIVQICLSLLTIVIITGGIYGFVCFIGMIYAHTKQGMMFVVQKTNERIQYHREKDFNQREYNRGTQGHINGLVDEFHEYHDEDSSDSDEYEAIDNSFIGRNHETICLLKKDGT